jgi:hypothetical protein
MPAFLPPVHRITVKTRAETNPRFQSLGALPAIFENLKKNLLGTLLHLNKCPVFSEDGPSPA